jgi:hypothetical protein
MAVFPTSGHGLNRVGWLVLCGYCQARDLKNTIHSVVICRCIKGDAKRNRFLGIRRILAKGSELTERARDHKSSALKHSEMAAMVRVYNIVCNPFLVPGFLASWLLVHRAKSHRAGMKVFSLYCYRACVTGRKDEVFFAKLPISPPPPQQGRICLWCTSVPSRLVGSGDCEIDCQTAMTGGLAEPSRVECGAGGAGEAGRVESCN